MPGASPGLLVVQHRVWVQGLGSGACSGFALHETLNPKRCIRVRTNLWFSRRSTRIRHSASHSAGSLRTAWKNMVPLLRILEDIETLICEHAQTMCPGKVLSSE